VFERIRAGTAEALARFVADGELLAPLVGHVVTARRG
jgi:hypothetical protein